MLVSLRPTSVSLGALAKLVRPASVTLELQMDKDCKPGSVARKARSASVDTLPRSCTCSIGAKPSSPNNLRQIFGPGGGFVHSPGVFGCAYVIRPPEAVILAISARWR